MKIRNGFVSNSSSASFVITINTSLDDSEIENYIRQSDEWVDKWWEGGEYQSLNISAIMNSNEHKEETKYREPVKDEIFSRENENTIKINLYTLMFNDWTDVPAWKFVRAISEGKIPEIKKFEIVQTENEYEYI